MSSDGGGKPSKGPGIIIHPDADIPCHRSFFGQVPPIVVAILLVTVYLPSASPLTDSEPPRETDNSPASQKSRFSRIDLKGSFLFTLSVLTLLLPIELGVVKLPWSHPVIAALFIASVALLVVFVAVEKRQEEPILPLEIFQRRDAVFSFLILGLQVAAQLGVRILTFDGEPGSY
jgi:uncharacterized ion transporter superfamily protein YfcC